MISEVEEESKLIAEYSKSLTIELKPFEIKTLIFKFQVK